MLPLGSVYVLITLLVDHTYYSTSEILFIFLTQQPLKPAESAQHTPLSECHLITKEDSEGQVMTLMQEPPVLTI